MFVEPIAEGTKFPVTGSEAVIEVVSHEMGGHIKYQPILPQVGGPVTMIESEFALRVLGYQWRPGVTWPSVPFMAEAARAPERGMPPDLA